MNQGDGDEWELGVNTEIIKTVEETKQLSYPAKSIDPVKLITPSDFTELFTTTANTGLNDSNQAPGQFMTKKWANFPHTTTDLIEMQTQLLNIYCEKYNATTTIVPGSNQVGTIEGGPWNGTLFSFVLYDIEPITDPDFTVLRLNTTYSVGYPELNALNNGIAIVPNTNKTTFSAWAFTYYTNAFKGMIEIPDFSLMDKITIGNIDFYISTPIMSKVQPSNGLPKKTIIKTLRPDAILTTDTIVREVPEDLSIYDEDGKLKVSEIAITKMIEANIPESSDVSWSAITGKPSVAAAVIEDVSYDETDGLLYATAVVSVVGKAKLEAEAWFEGITRSVNSSIQTVEEGVHKVYFQINTPSGRSGEIPTKVAILFVDTAAEIAWWEKQEESNNNDNGDNNNASLNNETIVCSKQNLTVYDNYDNTTSSINNPYVISFNIIPTGNNTFLCTGRIRYTRLKTITINSILRGYFYLPDEANTYLQEKIGNKSFISSGICGASCDATSVTSVYTNIMKSSDDKYYMSLNCQTSNDYAFTSGSNNYLFFDFQTCISLVV